MPSCAQPHLLEMGLAEVDNLGGNLAADNLVVDTLAGVVGGNRAVHHLERLECETFINN